MGCEPSTSGPGRVQSEIEHMVNAMTLGKYAEHRRARGLPGCSKAAVSKAIKAGRLAKSVVRDHRGQPKIADPELADREWRIVRTLPPSAAPLVARLAEIAEALRQQMEAAALDGEVGRDGDA